MFKISTNDTNGTNPEISQSLYDLAREGTRRMIAGALQLEVEECLSRVRHLRHDRGHAVAVRNGKAQERTVLLGAGSIKMRVPGCMTADWLSGRPDETRCPPAGSGKPRHFDRNPER